MPRGEMAIILHDALHILCIPVREHALHKPRPLSTLREGVAALDRLVRGAASGPKLYDHDAMYEKDS